MIPTPDEFSTVRVNVPDTSSPYITVDVVVEGFDAPKVKLHTYDGIDENTFYLDSTQGDVLSDALWRAVNSLKQGSS